MKQLDPLMKQDKLDPADFVDAVMEGIRDRGDGNIYALTPTFRPSALFYNKKLFAQAGVSPPTDGMSWDQVFDLAKRMKSGSGQSLSFGLTFDPWGTEDNFNDLMNYVSPLQLRMFDAQANKMTVNTPQWQEAWSTIAGLYKDHVLPHPEDAENTNRIGEGNNPYKGQLFLDGRAAMTVDDYGLINDLQRFNDHAASKLDWDVVSMPYHTDKPGIGSGVTLGQLAGINAQAANSDDAWEFVKFMNGTVMSKLQSRSVYEMPARKAFVAVRDGMSYNVAAFTKMRPAPDPSGQDQKMYSEFPNLTAIQRLGKQEYGSVIVGKMSVADALMEWDAKGNELLPKINDHPVGPIPGEDEALTASPPMNWGG